MPTDTSPLPPPDQLPPHRRGVIPAFTQPTPDQTPPAAVTAPPPAGLEPDQLDRAQWTRTPSSRDAADEPTRTVTSSVGKPKTAEVTALVIGLLALAVSAGAFLARARFGQQLRRPTKQQYRNIAEPLARIGLRHFDASALPADLGDVIAAGGAAGEYLTDGPMLLGPAGVIDDGVPDDLQEEYL